MSSNGRRASPTPFFDYPAGVAAAAAFAVRLVVGGIGVSQNPLLTKPQLDSEYYVDWARQIAAGDWAGAQKFFPGAHGPVPGLVAGAPFILNPLYAYVLAPIAGHVSDAALPMAIVALQSLLGAATAALAALAARRFFGRAAAWTAGLCVAFSTPLVQLDAHVAVSGLAAFLTAGAVFASAPPREGSSGLGHGPLVKGLWLGVGALARPITPLALPFFAWNEFRGAAPRRIARTAILVGAFAACALPSLVRNWDVGGEPVVYTTSSGLNAHLGNNPEARKFRAMVSSWIRFSPEQMHDDARIFVESQTGRPMTRSEVSSWFTRMTVEECIHAPGASAAYYFHKARWFFAPAEVPSSTSLANDLMFTPVLRVAFMPSWLVASAALVGAVVYRRRRDVLCGPGALALAHLAVLTLVFPLSHYRSPAIPALAVLAGGAVHAALAAWNEGARRRVAAIGAGVAAVALVGVCPPQPNPLREADEMLLGIDARDRGAWDEGIAHADRAIAAFDAEFPADGPFPSGLFLRGEIGVRRGAACLMRGEDEKAVASFESAVSDMTGVLKKEPGRWHAVYWRSLACQGLGRFKDAESDARRMVARYPLLAAGHARLCEVLTAMGRLEEAALEYAAAVRLDPGVGFDPKALNVLRQHGLR